MKKHISMLGLLLGFAAQAFSQSVTKTGTTAAPHLLIDAHARATAMGSANVSAANNASAMYWNPAGIAGVTGFAATFTHANWIADLSFNYVGAVLALGEFGNLGVNATFLTMDQIERTTIFSPDGTGELFDAGHYAVGLSYGRNLTDRFSIGFNAKYINDRMYHSTAYGFALDVGALFRTQLNGLTLGMSISNYGTKMRLDGRDLQIQYDPDPGRAGNNPNINALYQTDKFDLPLTFRVGVSMDVLKGKSDSNLILAVDALHPSDDLEYVNVGGEYVFHEMFFLRGGYKELFAKDSEAGLSFGGGIRYNMLGSTDLRFDYSYVDFGLFDAVHMFSVDLILNK
jgi:hypothetical protein